MNDLIFELCDKRRVYIEQDKAQDFVAECNVFGVSPQGGAAFLPQDAANPMPGKLVQTFYLEQAITEAEGRIIAQHYGLLGEYNRELSLGKDPFSALVEWDMV